jgi:uncharacterized Zn finger protein
LPKWGKGVEVLLWAGRGIAETNGWQVAQLYDLACGVHERRSAPLEVLRLRREQHERMASAGTYSRLRSAADAMGAWEIERDAARLALRERDLGGLVDALLDEGDVESAWSIAHEGPDWDPGLQQRLRLAEAREAQRPDQALPWYMLVVDELLIETGRRAYARAIPVLKHARRAADAAGQSEWFAARIADLREHHRRRPTFLAMLDKASLG